MAQRHEIMNYLRFVGTCKNHEWLLRTPLRHIGRLFYPHHILCTRKAYFGEVMKLLGRATRCDLYHYARELLDDTLIRRNYEESVKAGMISERKVLPYHEDYDDRITREEANVVNYYALVRELRPRVLVETGTAAGWMTSWILSALHRNGSGKLISIDIPPVEDRYTMGITVSKEDIGFLIPREYHDKWEYMMGDAKLLLPKVLSENEVDVFIHDSLHTRSHMLYEYQAAHCLMKPGSVIMSDDINWNRAFFSFVGVNNMRSLACVSNPNVGFTVNDFDGYEKGIGTDVIRI